MQSKTYVIGGRHLTWEPPGIVAQIQAVQLGGAMPSMAFSLVVGLPPAHIKDIGLDHLPPEVLAIRYPERMAEVCGKRWKLKAYLDAAKDCRIQIGEWFHREMGSDAVENAEGNSQAKEGASSVPSSSSPESTDAPSTS